MANENEQAEQVEQAEDVDTTTETVETVEDVAENEAVEETEEKPDDLVAKALEKEKMLIEQLAALDVDSENIFERNAILEQKLADAKKLADLEVKNKEMEGQLETIKRETIIKSLNLTEKMVKFADSLDFQQLEEFATMTPRLKTILDVKNPVGEESSTITKFKEEQETSRIM